MSEIDSRGNLAIVVGGSGLYLKELTHGLSRAPLADPDLRAQLNELSLHDLQKKLAEVDPKAASSIDVKNRRRLVRAVEVCLLTGKAASAQRTQWKSVGAAVLSGKSRGAAETVATTGVFVSRERVELYEQINRRVEAMFENGVSKAVSEAGAMGETA